MRLLPSGLLFFTNREGLIRRWRPLITDAIDFLFHDKNTSTASADIDRAGGISRT